MKTFSFFKLICMLVCSFALFVACSSGASENGASTGNSGGGSISDGTGGYGGNTGTGSGSGGNGGNTSSGSGSGGSSAEYIYIIPNEYLECRSTTYFIMESGEVYLPYSNTYELYRLKILDKSDNKVTDNVKIVSGECIKGTDEAIFLSNEGKYYITKVESNTSKEMTFKKDKDTFYAEGDEVKFGNVTIGDKYYEFIALKDGVIHFWRGAEYSSPIKVSDSYSFTQIIVRGYYLYAFTSDGSLYKLNRNTLQMEEIKDFYHHKTGSSYYINDKSNFIKVSETVKFKAIYSSGLLSTDNHIYYLSDGEIYRFSAKNTDGSYNDDFKVEEVFEEGTVYRAVSDGKISKYNNLIGKDSNGHYYDIAPQRFDLYAPQISSDYKIIEPTNDIIYNYYYTSEDWQVFYKTSEGLDVRGNNLSNGQLGIGRDDNGIISTTNLERMKVKFPEEVNVERVWRGENKVIAITDKGFYTWGKNSTGADNKAVPEKVKFYKITSYPAGTGRVYYASSNNNCDATLTYTEADNIEVKDISGDLIITEDGRVFQLYRGNLSFHDNWGGYNYTCSPDNLISNSFVQLDLDEGAIAKGFYGRDDIITNIGIFSIWSGYFNWRRIQGNFHD